MNDRTRNHPAPPRDWQPLATVSLAQALDVSPGRLTLEWRKACRLRAVEEPSMPHLRQQLRRRKRARNWRG